MTLTAASSGWRSRHRTVRGRTGCASFFRRPVTVPAGATTAQFTVTSTLTATDDVITATYNGVNKTATLSPSIQQ